MQLPLADNKEFRAVLYDEINGKVDLEDINLILDKYADALSIWLKFTEQPVDGFIIARNEEFEFTLKNEESHYLLNMKATSATLNVLSDKLGKIVKNG